ncbi:caprin-1-like, partial [Limulus polyphemus]|uniref:Caprin-1-like n=1 Tax=Limulus polyphemus TaxID=6850 RepID=A0ABM1RYG9_LIMPO
MGTENVRKDFLLGSNKALELSEKDLRNLDELFKLVSPKRETKEEVASFEEQLDMAAEHLINLVEGKSREVLGTTYKFMKELLLKINESGYFDPSCEASIENRREYECCDSDKYIREENEKAELEVEVTTTENIQVCPNQPESPTEAYDKGVLVVYPTSYSNSKHLQEILDEHGNLNFFPESQTDLESPHIDPAFLVTYPMAPTPYQYPTGVDSSHQQVAVVLSEYDPAQPIPTQTFINQNYPSIQSLLDPTDSVKLNLAMASSSRAITPSSTRVTNANNQPDVRYPCAPVRGSRTSGGGQDEGGSIFSSDIKYQEKYSQVRGSNFGGRGREGYSRSRGSYSSDKHTAGYRGLNKFNNHYGYSSNFRQDGRQGGFAGNRP